MLYVASLHNHEIVASGMYHIVFISPLPVKPGGGGTIGFLAVCHSVRPSVLLSVSQSVSPLGVRPLGFPNFSQSSFEILT